MPEVTPVIVPRQNTNDDQAVLVHWLVESGSRVAATNSLQTGRL